MYRELVVYNDQYCLIVCDIRSVFSVESYYVSWEKIMLSCACIVFIVITNDYLVHVSGLVWILYLCYFVCQE